MSATEYSNTLTFYLNGKKQVLENPSPTGTLLDYIRSTGLTGTKLGCSEGGCGACTVDVSSWDPVDQKVHHAAVNSCIVPLIFVEGKHLTTVEGIGSVSDIHPAQERIALFHGSQCGFCTPGIVMSLYSLLRETDGHPSEKELGEAFDGNLCRCTGYKPIIDAASTFSCGRAGGCCRDKKPATEDSTSDSDDSAKTSMSAVSDTSSGISEELASTAGATVGGDYGALPVPEGSLDINEHEVSKDGKRHTEDASSKKSIDKCSAGIAGVSPNGVPYKAYDNKAQLIFPPYLKRHKVEPLKFGNKQKTWFRPVTKQQLLEILDEYPNAKIVGGASEIQIEIKMKNLEYNVSVFANDIKELATVEYVPGKGLFVGPNVSLTKLEHKCEQLAEELGHSGQVFAAIASQLKYFAGRQIRNAATPAGNIATASPIADLNPILVSTATKIIVESVKGGSQELSMDDFFLAYRKTRLPPQSAITRIFIAETQPTEYVKAFKQAKRKDDDISIVTASMRILLEEGSSIVRSAALAFGGMAPITKLSKETDNWLVGKDISKPETLEGAIESLSKEMDLSFSVPGGMASFRKTLVLSFFYQFYQYVLNSRFSSSNIADVQSLQEVTREHGVKGARDLDNPFEQSIVGKSNIHVSALKQVTGEAQYVDDMPPLHNELFGVQVMSTKARAKIVSVDWSEAEDLPGVYGHVDINDLPNKAANLWGAFPTGKEQFFADGEVFFVGQCIGVILAKDRETAAKAAPLVKVEYEELEAVITIEQAREKKSYFETTSRVDKGDPDAALASSKYVFSGTARMGAQEHFYLETQGCLVSPSEDGELTVYASSQNPNETQLLAAQVTGVLANRVVARVKRLGGGFGGKETRSCQLSSIAAVAAKKTKRPVRMILSRSEDMLTSGQRHPFLMEWTVGLDENYRFTALKADLYANGGWSMDLTKGVMDRAVLHADGCYFFPTAQVEAFPCKTNTASNTAFRGFGGPQGMFLSECMIYEVSEALGIEADYLRDINYYQAGQRTHYNQLITEDFSVPTLVEKSKASSSYDELRNEVEQFNKTSKWIKKGLAHVPTKFGVAFGKTFLNQGGALVHIYHDGSILVAHGGTEIGQGLNTKMAMIAAQELQIPLEKVFIAETATNTVANASATAASASSDVNGGAVKAACEELNRRLEPYRKQFDNDMHKIANAAYLDRVNLSANGFYKMPDINYEWGNPNSDPAFFYYTQGSAVSLVEVNTLTGDWACLRTDIAMDLGQSLNQAIDYGQIEGAYVQGQGLFTLEESLWFNHNGALFTRGPGAYKIPGFRDVPQTFNVQILKDRSFKHLKSVHRSKGIGEPPLFLGSAPMFAIRDALKYARKEHGVTEPIKCTIAPLTTERIRNLVGDKLSKIGHVEQKDGEKNFFLVA